MARLTLKERNEKFLTVRVPEAWWYAIADHASVQETSVSRVVRNWVVNSASEEGLDLTAIAAE